MLQEAQDKLKELVEQFNATNQAIVDAQVEAAGTAYDALSDEHKSMHPRPVKYNLP